MSIKERIYNASPVWGQNLLVSLYGRHLYQQRYTGIYADILELVRASANWTVDRVRQHQAERLHEMVKHCRTSVPYYQKLFAEHGLHETDFTEVEHVHKLPLLTKATLKAHPDQFKSRDVQGFVTQHTSGSTGTPLALDVDEYTYKLAMALLVDHEERNGVQFGARRATFAGRMIQPASRFRPPYSRFNRAENQRLFSSYHLNETTFADYNNELNRFRPEEIIGYPSAIADLANHYLRTDIRPRFRPTVVITNSETLLDWQREKIERVFSCPVRDYYGTAEYVVFGGQGPDLRYRLSPLIGITELLDVSGGPGNRLVATSLTNHSMPLLRYEIGDTAEPSVPSDSTITYSLSRVNGRTDDYIELPDGRRLGRLDHVFKGIDELTEAQIIQDAKAHCTIRVVMDRNIPESVTTKIRENFRQRAGDAMEISIERVPHIPRGANGKFKNVLRDYQ